MKNPSAVHQLSYSRSIFSAGNPIIRIFDRLTQPHF
jgi:hypothetical protein